MLIEQKRKQKLHVLELTSLGINHFSQIAADVTSFDVHWSLVVAKAILVFLLELLSKARQAKLSFNAISVINVVCICRFVTWFNIQCKMLKNIHVHEFTD